MSVFLTKEQQDRRLALRFILPSLLVMGAIVGIPLLMTIAASFTDLNQRNFVFERQRIAQEIADTETFIALLDALAAHERAKEKALAAGFPQGVHTAAAEQAAVLAQIGDRPIARLFSLMPDGRGERPQTTRFTDLGGLDATALAERVAANLALLATWRSEAAATREHWRRRLATGGVQVVGPANYVKVLGQSGSEFWRVLGQTVIWTVVNVALHFLGGLGLALLLNQRPAGSALYRTLLMVPWAIPSFVAAFSWRLMFNFPDGFLNQLLTGIGLPAQNFLGDPSLMLASCILVNVWAGIPFMMITLLGGLQNIDGDLYEAADVEGASTWVQFRQITLPLLRPVATVAILLGIIWTFNMFNIIYLVTLGSEAIEKDILVTYAYKAFRLQGDYAGSATYAVLILSMLLAFGSYYQRVAHTEEGSGHG